MDALLVIDVQQALIKAAYREAQVLEAINLSIDKVRDRGGMIVFIQHCHSSFEPMKKGNPGWQLHPLLKQRDGDLIVEKEASDAFYQTTLASELAQASVQKIFVTGLQTEFCVDATCRAALSRDFEVILVADAHTTGDAHLSAAEIVNHHNNILAALAHPNQQIQVIPSSDV